MINPAQKPSNLNRREALQTVGATVALAAGGLTGNVDAFFDNTSGASTMPFFAASIWARG